MKAFSYSRYFLMIIMIWLAIVVNAQTAEEHFKEGMAAYDESEYAGAIDHFSAAITLKADYSQAYFYRGDSRFFQDDYRGAVEDFTKCIEYDPDNITAYLYRGDCKFYLKFYKGAINDYTDALELDSRNGKTYSFRADAKYYLEDYIGAVIDYSNAIKYGYEESEVYSIRGECYYEIGKYIIADDDLTKAIRMDPTQGDWFYLRANIREELSNYDNACMDAQKAKLLGMEDAQEMIDRLCVPENLVNVSIDMDFCDILDLLFESSVNDFEDIIGTVRDEEFSLAYNATIQFPDAIETYILDIILSMEYIAIFSYFSSRDDEMNQAYMDLVRKVIECHNPNDWKNLEEYENEDDYDLRTTTFTLIDDPYSSKISVFIYKISNDQLELLLTVGY